MLSIFDILKTCHDKTMDASKALRFDKSHPWHINLVALHCSIIELVGCMVTLLNVNCNSGVPSIFRTLLETYVEFKNLLDDRCYVYHMEATYRYQWLKLLREAKKGNPHLSEIANALNLDEEIQTNEEKLNKLKIKKYSPLTVFERFLRCGMEVQYRSLYNMLCNHDHPNIRALIERHIEMSDGDFSVVLYKGQPTDEYESDIHYACCLLNDSAIRLHKALNSPVLSQLEELNELVKNWANVHLTTGWIAPATPGTQPER